MSFLPPRLSARLGTLAHRLGLQLHTPRQVTEAALKLRLRFPSLDHCSSSIAWASGAPWERLAELPSDALAGPVQEDKAAARAALVRAVVLKSRPALQIDLKDVQGVMTDDAILGGFTDFEDYLAKRSTRTVRIISYTDFQKALALALPRLDQTLEAKYANWRGDGYFLSGANNIEALASAVVYARYRNLDVTLTTDATCYSLSNAGLRNLSARYYVLAFAPESWSNPDLLSVLVESGLPYARLSAMSRTDSTEYLLLPKAHPEAAALGEGLLLSGAADLAAHLRSAQLGAF
jgi:hypothetical protein